MAVESIQTLKHQHAHAHFSVANRLAAPWIQPLSTQVHNRSYLIPPTIPVPAQETMRLNLGSLVTAAVRRVHVTPWPQQQAGKRQKAISCWRIIVEENLSCTTLGNQLHGMALESKSEAEMVQAVEDTFANKSTATLERRGSSLLKFMVWHRNSCGVAGLCLLYTSDAADE